MSPFAKTLAEAFAPPTGEAKAGIELSRSNCEKALQCRLHELCLEEGGESLATRLGIGWPVMARWLWDTGHATSADRKALSRNLKLSAVDLHQDWALAATVAERLLRLRKDLAWPYAVLGWSKERAGEITGAVEVYRAGLPALGTTQDFTEPWVTDAPYVKFSTRRLMSVDANTLTPPEREYLASARNGQCGEFWTRQGQAHEGKQEWGAARACYLRSAWDEWRFEEASAAVQRLLGVAKKMGSKPLAALAKLHLASAP